MRKPVVWIAFILAIGLITSVFAVLEGIDAVVHRSGRKGVSTCCLLY